jgi:hypothetical protein
VEARKHKRGGAPPRPAAKPTRKRHQILGPPPNLMPQRTDDFLVELKGKALYVTPDDIEINGYTVVSSLYLARLEYVAHCTFSFLENEIDSETLQEVLTDG